MKLDAKVLHYSVLFWSFIFFWSPDISICSVERVLTCVCSTNPEQRSVSPVAMETADSSTSNRTAAYCKCTGWGFCVCCIKQGSHHCAVLMQYYWSWLAQCVEIILNLYLCILLHIHAHDWTSVVVPTGFVMRWLHVCSGKQCSCRPRKWGEFHQIKLWRLLVLRNCRLFCINVWYGNHNFHYSGTI